MKRALLTTVMLVSASCSSSDMRTLTFSSGDAICIPEQLLAVTDVDRKDSLKRLSDVAFDLPESVVTGKSVFVVNVRPKSKLDDAVFIQTLLKSVGGATENDSIDPLTGLYKVPAQNSKWAWHYVSVQPSALMSSGSAEDWYQAYCSEIVSGKTECAWRFTDSRFEFEVQSIKKNDLGRWREIREEVKSSFTKWQKSCAR